MPPGFGQYLRGLRQRRNLSQRQLGRLAGVSAAYISEVERGVRGVPSPKILEKLARPLRVEYNELMRQAGYLKIEQELPTFVPKVAERYIDVTDIPEGTIKAIEQIVEEIRKERRARQEKRDLQEE
ncbi:HTH-type transcriptional regulator, competence development regulator [Candidatus Hakubella thermalkaliphila]|uniref:HTH-type transcriptional regulator, competence development regulator n=1 Tax=Candidatus Hakubella thermalkaliphila TaxID=2754717 RepID=A0A6V8QAX7_9ACTN|nr:transcriptional regulator [Candidatus Hakubella thermalkaliphila]GFP19416.1 HTH-type transcriptional regulator, competence development regulator [Candidatus Hakubella thermalkaliphila]GFP30715.1 HTH-type transcriptional regulator, competence development regulator [Candidatus Hakubella thermalkaliphila]GFP40031.1 HTH-type transcriptional regulator, competence development regulator [Candidatus Hakubella thermalkaliphila]